MASTGQRSSSFSSTLVDVFRFDASERRANVRSCDAGMLRLLSRSSAQHNRPSQSLVVRPAWRGQKPSCSSHRTRPCQERMAGAVLAHQRPRPRLQIARRETRSATINTRRRQKCLRSMRLKTIINLLPPPQTLIAAAVLIQIVARHTGAQLLRRNPNGLESTNRPSA
jgi:hypothetical protein